MIYVGCCVFDTATAAYGRPFFIASVAQAVRSFTDEVNNPQSDLFKHPKDFLLYQVAGFDDSIGQPTEVDKGFTPRLITRAADVLTPIKS